MLKEYTTKDASLPLILPQTVFRREIYEPVSSLVNYVNDLFQEGYSAETLRQDLVDMYALDFYDSQVRNGGHSQFIHNSFEHRETGMERAARAARMIGLPEMATLLDQCATFCGDNPELANSHDILKSTEFLSELDSAHGNLEYTHEERTTYLFTLPPGHCDDLRDKFRFDDLDDTITAIVAEVDRLLLTKTQDDAAKGAAELARSFFKEKISKTRGPEPSEYKDRDVDRDIERLAGYIKIALRDSTLDERTENVTFQVRDKMLDPGLYDLSRYHIHAAAWIAQHPHVELVPIDGWKPRVEAIAAASPFAMFEKRRRQLERVTRKMPDDTQLAIGEAMAILAHPDRSGPFFEYTKKRVDLSPHYLEAHFAKTSDGELLLCKTSDRVDFYSLKQNWRFALAKRVIKILQRSGMIHRLDLLDWPSDLPLKRLPGAPKRSMLPETILNWLKSHPQRAMGQRIAHGLIVPGKADLMHKLHVPEAYMQWIDHSDRSIHFHLGVLESYDADAERIAWTFPHADEVHQMVACTNFVEFSILGGNRQAQYPIEQLSKLRCELAPSIR